MGLQLYITQEDKKADFWPLITLTPPLPLNFVNLGPLN